jgi:hypothetical protein
MVTARYFIAGLAAAIGFVIGVQAVQAAAYEFSYSDELASCQARSPACCSRTTTALR